jgi:lipopolysaccharide exporter
MVSQSPSVSRQMATGAAWMVLFKVVDRCIGLVSTVVLARVLVPADFGLIALATSVIAMLEVIGAFGFDTALVQRSGARREHFDTVWTLNVLLGLAIGMVVVGFAWPTAWLYGDQVPRITRILPSVCRDPRAWS